MYDLLIQHRSSRSAVSHRLLSDLITLSLISHLFLTLVFTIPLLSLLAYITSVIRSTPHLMMSISAEYNIPIYKYSSKPRLN